MSIRRFTILSSVAIAAFAFATNASAQDADGRRELVRDALEREAPPLRGVRSLEDGLIEPTPWQGLPDDPRRPVAPTNPLPGIAWTPGGPGSGGGSGEPSPFGIDAFEIAPLPCPEGAVSCAPVGLNDSGTRVVGWADFGAQAPTDCDPPPRSRAVAWDLDDDGSVAQTHVLPNDVDAGAIEYAAAVEANDGAAIVGVTFHRFYPREVGGAPCAPFRRLSAWRQIGIRSWVKEDLPVPDGALGVGGPRVWITADGWVIGQAVLDVNGNGAYDAPESNSQDGRQDCAWIPDTGAPSGYRIEVLPLPTGFSSMDVNDVGQEGLVVGSVDQVTVDGRVTRAAVWERAPSADWQVTVLETAGPDGAAAHGIDADGLVRGSSLTWETERVRGTVYHLRHAVMWRRDPVDGFWLPPEDLGRYADDIYSFGAVDSDASGLVVGEERSTGLPRVTIWDRSEIALLQDRVDGVSECDNVVDVGGWHRMLVSAVASDGTDLGTVLLVPPSE